MMSESDTEAAVKSFFVSYREAFERADATAVAGHFGESVHVASDTGTGVRLEFMTSAEWRSTIDQLLARYRALGVGSAELQDVEVTNVSERLVQASVYWGLFDRDGRALYDFQALYTLASDSTRWRIVAIAHDEFARSRRYLARQRPGA